MGKKHLVLFIVIFTTIFNDVYSQQWIVKDSVIRFPSNFGSWIQRNIGTYNPFHEAVESRIPSFQLKEIGDFNHDGFNDLCMELYLRIFDTNNPSNPGKYQDSLTNYYKGIFINQKNGTFMLDTNYIIHGRGATWDGGFGDFNHDGLTDYYNNCAAYEFDQKTQDTLFYKYSNKNYSPSHVYFNNGKSFDRMDLDTIDMMSGSSEIIDINNDGKDEIIALPSSKFIVYEYDNNRKIFQKKLNNVNEFIAKQYSGQTIKFFNFEKKIDNSILLTLSYNSFGLKENSMIDILKINLLDSTINIINTFKHPSYVLNDGTLITSWIADRKGVFKYEDLNNDSKEELIFLGNFGFDNPLPSVFQSNQRMGINIIENNQQNTIKYWDYDTTEIGFRVGGYIKDLNGDRVSEIISHEWILDSSKKYFEYYYSLDSGKYKKNYIKANNRKFTPKKTWNNKYNVWAEDFEKDNYSDILVWEADNIMNNFMYYSINCKDVKPKPTFTTTKYTFCSGDSLKLTVNNVYKGDTLKWYYGNKSDLTNVSNKIFTDSTALFVTRTDSLGCVISSDTISITKIISPSAPVVKDTIFCQNVNASTLAAIVENGNTLTWYGTNATGGTSSPTATIASTTDTVTKSYYVSQINNSTSCESPRAKITVKINPAPIVPNVRDTVYCNNINADTLKATSLTGHTLNWYGTSATGGTGINLGSKPNTSIVGNFSYYVSQINYVTGCEGARAKIGVIINPLPIAPIVRDTSYCNNASSDTIRVNASAGSSLLWYGTNATGGTSTTTSIKPSTVTVGTANYYLSQIITATGCEGLRSKITVTTKPIPSAPTLSRDTSNFLLSGATGTTWYKDGVVVTDTTQRYKPTTPGSYAAKTTLNGCTSALSTPYYYLVTDIINLSKDEFIKLAPNPFINQLNIDFVIKGYQKLNMEVFDIANGSKVASKQGVTPGMSIYLNQLSAGTYVIKLTSNDNKISQQFKMVKL